MTEDPLFLTVEQVLSIHDRVVSEFGGNAAVREHGLVESAVMMPASRYAGDFLHVDIPAMAAAYLFHLCRNHPFADGNKRTALAAAEVFLLLNGHELQAGGRQIERLVLGVADGSTGKDEAVAFFREQTRPDTRPGANAPQAG